MDSFMLIRGIVSIVIGILAIAWPGMTIAVLVGIFGVYAIIDGITNLFIGFSRARADDRSWAHVAQGLVGIGAGVLAFVWPGVTALALVFFIAAWAVVALVVMVYKLRTVFPRAPRTSAVIMSILALCASVYVWTSFGRWSINTSMQRADVIHFIEPLEEGVLLIGCKLFKKGVGTLKLA